MRILLKTVLDCEPDAAWEAIRSPRVFREVAAPLMTFTSLEEGGLPDTWPEGRHLLAARAFGALDAGRQCVDVRYSERQGARLLRDSGHGVSGALSLVTGWRHTMAVSPAPGGRTLYRDELVFRAGPLTLPAWAVLWLFWQWRGKRLRRLAPDWAVR